MIMYIYLHYPRISKKQLQDEIPCQRERERERERASERRELTRGSAKQWLLQGHGRSVGLDTERDS